MNSSADLRAALQREIAERSAAAARKVLAAEAGTDDLDRVALLQRTLDLLPAGRDRTWLWAVAVAIACMGALTLVATIRVPSTVVELEVETGLVNWQLARAFNLQGIWRIEPDKVTLKNFDHADLPPEFPVRTLNERASLKIEAKDGTAAITALTVDRVAKMSLSGSDRSVDLDVDEAAASLQLAVTGQVAVHVEDSAARCCPEPIIFDGPPGEFVVSRSAGGAVSTRLLLTPIPSTLKAEAMQLRDLYVASLSLWRERTDAHQHSVQTSEVRSGTLVLLDTEDKVALPEGAELHLVRASGVINSLRTTPDGIAVRFSGVVHGLVLGNDDVARDLMPTWFDYLRHQQRVGFLWGAMTFLWSLLWSARQLLLKS